MYFSPIIPESALWLLCAAFACLAMLAAIYFFRVRTVVNYRRRADRERPDKPDAEFLPASVIIYSQGDADALLEMLKTVLAQEYPAAYEVIVVNEGESADIRDTVSMLRATHNNLYLTFTPEGVVNLSRKKLALTLGIKAARYDVVVLTTTAAEITSPLWLRRMMRRFDKDGKVDIVLGYSYIDPDEDDATGKRRRAFDYIADSVRWLGVAIAGKPFRGTEYNLAYRKSVFFKNKGFSKTLHLKHGDDDLFINDVANRNNTAIELSIGSIIEVPQSQPQAAHKISKLRYGYTAGKLRTGARLFFGSCSLAWWLFTGCCIALAIVGLPSFIPMITAAVLYLALSVILALAWRTTSRALMSRSLLLTVPWFMTFEPIYNLWYRIKGFMKRGSNLSWN